MRSYASLGCESQMQECLCYIRLLNDRYDLTAQLCRLYSPLSKAALFFWAFWKTETYFQKSIGFIFYF